MKAIRVHQFGGPEVLRIEEIPRPSVAEGRVVVQIHAAGVNPYDTYIRTGRYAIKPALPYTPTEPVSSKELVGAWGPAYFAVASHGKLS